MKSVIKAGRNSHGLLMERWLCDVVVVVFIIGKRD